jgi:sugar phosphate permease
MNATHLQSTIIITFNSQNNTGKLKSNVFFFFVAYYIFYISVRRRYYVQQLLTTITLLFNAAMTDRPQNLGIQSNAEYST